MGGAMAGFLAALAAGLHGNCLGLAFLLGGGGSGGTLGFGLLRAGGDGRRRVKICQERKRRAEFWVSVFLFLPFCFFWGSFWFLIKEMTERGSDRKCEARRGEAKKAANIFPPTLDTGFTRRMRKKEKNRGSWELHTSSSA